MEIIQATVVVVLGTFFLAVEVAGYFNIDLNVVERVLLFVAAICLISPEIVTSVIGIVLGAVLLFLNTARKKKAAA